MSPGQCYNTVPVDVLTCVAYSLTHCLLVMAFLMHKNSICLQCRTIVVRLRVCMTNDFTITDEMISQHGKVSTNTQIPEFLSM